MIPYIQLSSRRDNLLPHIQLGSYNWEFQILGLVEKFHESAASFEILELS